MRNKGAIKVFAIALALVSIYQLSFTWITNSVRDSAEEYAKENANNDPNKEIKYYNAYIDSIASEPVYSFFWIRDYTYKDCLNKELNQGLDLQGGMNVTLEVSVIDLIKSLSNNSNDTTFLSAIELAKQYQKDSQDDFVTLFGKAFTDIDPNGKLAAIFSTLDLKDRVKYSSTNEEVIAVIQEEAQDAIDNSFNILRTRIDRFGVTQPNIQRLEGASGRILIELPGVKDPDRVRKLLQGTAKLEFWETFENSEVISFLEAADKKLAQVLKAEKQLAESSTDGLTDSTETDTALNDSTAIEESLLTAADSTKEETLLADSTAVGEDAAAKAREDHPLFSIMTPNIDQDRRAVRGAVVGICHTKDTAKLNSYLRKESIAKLFPSELKFAWEVKAINQQREYDENGTFHYLIALKSSLDKRAALSGDVIKDASSDFDQTRASAVVNMTMNTEGANTWARITKQNIDRQVAIVLDDFVYSHPNVNSEITGGRSEISGSFTINEAKDLANVLKSGRLPAPARIIEEAVVGPSLGQEAIDSGLSSFVIAFIIVLLYMIFYYKTAGIVADIALIANIFFIFGVLASLGAVLTLPGIAGIVLTIGMSVDANVLIYERIREELKLGKGIKIAVADGYKNAYSAIIDANVTTLLTGIILYVFGHGPIKGFATTLIIGILTSLFAAIFLTRLVFIWFLNRNKNVSFSTKLTANAFKNLNIDFIGKRKIYYTISGIIIVAGLVSLVVRGLNQGVDFKGGRTYIVRFDQEVNTTEIAQALKVEFEETPEVKTFGADGVKITTAYKIDENEPAIDEIVETKLYEGIKGFFKTSLSFDNFKKEYDGKVVGKMSSQKVGPTIADDIKVAAIWSILFSLGVMFLYIFIRFRNWQYGLGALLALIHDTLIVLGLFSLLYGVLPFSLEIDQAFIAAILTVVGYSINDTVVVFDRIREFLTTSKKQEKQVVYNEALNSTLSRTFSTSLSTFVVLLAIFIFGGDVIRGFIFALLIGVVVGTYSSLFIATPVVFDTVKKVEIQLEKIKGKKQKKQVAETTTETASGKKRK